MLNSVHQWNACLKQKADNLLDSIYPINPYTKERELPLDPSWFWKPTPKEQEKWDPSNQYVQHHIFQFSGSSRHFSHLAVKAYPEKSWSISPITFQEITQKVFERITQCTNQMALDAGDPRYQLNYELEFVKSKKDTAHARTFNDVSQIAFEKDYLCDKDLFIGEDYAFLSLESKIAATMAHEVAHHCLGHTRRKLLSPLILIISALLVTFFAVTYLFFPKSFHFPFVQLIEAQDFKELLISGLNAGLGILIGHYFSPFLLLERYFSRQDERNADRLATEFLYQAGYDIRAAEHNRLMYKDLASHSTHEDLGYWESIKQKWKDWTSTHPPDQERYEAAKKASKAYFKKYGHHCKGFKRTQEVKENKNHRYQLGDRYARDTEGLFKQMERWFFGASPRAI